MINAVKIIEKKKHKLIVEIEGDKHTIPNLVVDELYNDSDIKAASYYYEHPLQNTARIIVETKTKDPQKALIDAITRLERRYKEIRKKISEV